MNSIDELNHQVLQRLIIMFLGILTLAVIMQSCTVSSAPCSAYDHIEVTDDNLPTE
jgi:hypothetical protein